MRPDAKSQVTLEYSDDNKPQRIDAIVISTQHDDFAPEAEMLAKIKSDLIAILIPRIKAKYPQYAHLFNYEITYHINPTGKFVIGGPHGDTGLTGRKIIVDTYGGKGAHGGGAFSGKDPSKVDRVRLMLRVTLLKIWLQLVLLTKFWFRFRMLLVLQNQLQIIVDTYGTSKVNLTNGEISKVVEAMFSTCVLISSNNV